MALQYYVGNFQLNTSTGAQSVTGVGFQPKALLVYHNPFTVDIGVPQIANYYYSMGMTDGAANEYAQWCFTPNGNAGLEASYYKNSSSFIYGANNGSTYWSANLTGFTGDGFNINVDVAPPDVYRVGYLAIGGDVDVAVGGLNASGSTGTQSVSGLGFQPTGLIMATVGAATAWASGAPSNGHVRQSFGFSDGTLDRSSSFMLRNGGVTVKINGRRQSNTHMVEIPNITVPYSTSGRATLSSFDVDGFTINWSTAAPVNTRLMWLAVGGVDTKVGNFTTPAVTGVNTVISGLTFQPNAVVTTSSNQSAFNVPEGFGAVGSGQGAEYSHGMATDELEMHNIEAAAQDFVTISYAGSYASEVALSANYRYNNRNILDEQFAFDAFNIDGMDINASTVLGSGNSVISYLIMEGDGGGPTPPDNPTGGSGGPDSPDSIFLTTFIGI